MIDIVQSENPVLRKIADEVPLTHIGSTQVKKAIRDMKAALRTQADGVAIAAPQIGVSLRIFLVAGKIFDEAWQKGEAGAEPSKKDDVVFINPILTKLSKKKR